MNCFQLKAEAPTTKAPGASGGGGGGGWGEGGHNKENIIFLWPSVICYSYVSLPKLRSLAQVLGSAPLTDRGSAAPLPRSSHPFQCSKIFKYERNGGGGGDAHMPVSLAVTDKRGMGVLETILPCQSGSKEIRL